VAYTGEFAGRIIPCRTMADLTSAIRTPRPVIIMEKAGDAVDEQINLLRDVLERDDIIIDAGNANYHDTVRRDGERSKSGLTFIGIGASGGEEGARHGRSIIVGGLESPRRRAEKVLTAISAKYEREPCCAWIGAQGAGHFVKTMHNGIKHADMQMIAETHGHGVPDA
jgi:6-phosphogluconate dehydrogenase